MKSREVFGLKDSSYIPLSMDIHGTVTKYKILTRSSGGDLEIGAGEFCRVLMLSATASKEFLLMVSKVC